MILNYPKERECTVIHIENQADTSAPREATCDHIVGFRLASFPQHGEKDRLIRIGEKTEADELFNYCPVCGGLFVVSAFLTR